MASALFSTDKPPDHLTPRLVTEITDQSPKPAKKGIETFINADKTEALPEQQEDVCDLWTLDSFLDTHVADKSFSQCKFSNSRGTNPRSSVEKDTDFSFERQPASTDLESLTQMTSSLLEDSMSSWFGSIERTRTYSKPRPTKYSDMKSLPTEVEVPDLSPPSPVISLLSLDSCDLEVQMLVDAEHSVQAQDGTIVESLQMDFVDDLDLLDCSGNHEDLLLHNNYPKCKMAEWMDPSEEDGRYLQETCAFPNSLDVENLTGSVGGTNLGQTNHEFLADVLCGQEPHRRSFHHDQTNYAMNIHGNILEDCFGQVEPCMKKIDTDFPVINGNDSSHHMFLAFESQLDQSKRILYDDWEQQPLKSSYKNYTSPGTDQIMMQGTDIRNENLNQTVSDSQCPIMCCLEGFCYHKEESCLYTKFRAYQSSHNFEGVARSFPASLHKLHPTPIPTPPLDDDWLFSNIVAEEEVNNMSNTFGKY
ncbi:hypothetical protein M9458_032975 [Cirrhinus mrigala]|uniref:Uncharacterized protein n=1 Tax=Cirrhinus mrigala TaxID=683832 RepID=A0ABD0PF13_CIRMR